jgi:hypothetical protein
MPRPRLDINRKLTGWIALFFLLGGLIGMITGWISYFFWGGMIRNGIVLGALWLALPTQNRPAAWEDISWSSVILVLITALVLLSSRMKWYAIPIVVGVGLLVYFLRRPIKR